MKHAEAEKLLGGYATGTLTEAERRALFEAALEHQDLFDALADEEALRELLADPAARAHLLSALAPGAPPKVVPFYRHPGLIGAAASLIVAATAGLAYLRSPGTPLPAARQETAKAAPTGTAKVGEAPVPAQPLAQAQAQLQPQLQPQVAPARKVPPATGPEESASPRPIPTPAAVPTLAPAPLPASRVAAAEAPAGAEDAAREDRAKKAERSRPVAALAAPAPAAAVVEVLGQVAGAPAMTKAIASDRAERKVAEPEGASPAPIWSLEPQPDGITRVLVTAARGAEVSVLRRTASGVEVLKLRVIQDHPDAPARWVGQVRLGPGDVLDLYLMKGPVADPAKLPETGPVEGFRARIHPAEKKDAPR
ncbi:hypothetical protein GETHOR_22610 [Geothrix oryzae]|uniref:Uncharacterized protein n=1 Tax=Geothrix oryzae TaxID=2927975 RepID=A0ABN6V8P3_9BACT|nr:hypothetical protein [Geothrix oryzae]BDU70160.1 hypothetical protein GETHOR_22610 [Geothrix oryzae]